MNETGFCEVLQSHEQNLMHRQACNSTSIVVDLNTILEVPEFLEYHRLTQ